MRPCDVMCPRYQCKRTFTEWIILFYGLSSGGYSIANGFRYIYQCGIRYGEEEITPLINSFTTHIIGHSILCGLIASSYGNSIECRHRLCNTDSAVHGYWYGTKVIGEIKMIVPRNTHCNHSVSHMSFDP